MDHAARSSVVEVQAATTLSSKSEEVLVGIQNLSINERVASSRAIDNPVRVEYYSTRSAFFNFEALEEAAPLSAIPHFAIGSVKEDPTSFRSVDPIDDDVDEIPAEPD